MSDAQQIARPRLRAPGPQDHKYTRGKVVVVAGAMPGAAMLAAMAAQRSGAGYVELLGGAGEGAPHALVRRGWDASALEDQRNGAVVVGPGLGTDDAGAARLEASLAARAPLVLDADALTLIGAEGLPRLRRLPHPPVLTPHAGEYARLFGAETDLRAAAARAGAVIILKGAASRVAHPDGRLAIAPAAPAWLASAGTGDVLAGIVGTMYAQLQDPFDAAQAALWLHGEAARRAGPVLIADDLIPALREAVTACL